MLVLNVGVNRFLLHSRLNWLGRIFHRQRLDWLLWDFGYVLRHHGLDHRNRFRRCGGLLDRLNRFGHNRFWNLNCLLKFRFEICQTWLLGFGLLWRN